MQRVVDQAVELIAGAEGAMVGLSSADAIVYVCGSGWLISHLGTQVESASSLSGLAVRTGQVLVCDHTETDARVDRDACRRLGVASMVCVPLYRGSEVLGVLAVSSSRPSSFLPDDVALLNQMADVIGVAIGLAGDLARVSGEITTLVHPSAPGVPADGGRFLMSVLNPEAVALADSRQRIRGVLEDPESMSPVFQPIIDLSHGQVIAVEALSRFQARPVRPPDEWFADAHRCGLGLELEMLAVAKALEGLHGLPVEVSLTVNAGPDTIVSAAFDEAIAATRQAGRIIVELTEHSAVADYPKLMGSIMRLRNRGVRLAVDDTGAGFASLAHILKLAPDFIKLDRELVRGIDLDPVRRALATALVAFGGDTGSEILAEGIETADELATVRRLGVRYAQGYFVGRPAPLAAIADRSTVSAKRS